MQGEMGGSGRCDASQHGLKLTPRFESLQFVAVPYWQLPGARSARPDSDRQALAAFGAARIDHGAATAGLHADQKAVGTGAANLGGLVSAFHVGIL